MAVDPGSHRTGVACSMRVLDGVSIPDTVVAAHLFRIVEEAVQNALRHAAPKRIDIRLRCTRTGLLLTIWNDGRPLPARLDLEKGMGLRTMRFRAHLVGGELEIRRVAGGGTQVSCLVPDTRHAKDPSREASASRRATAVKAAVRGLRRRRTKKT